MIISGWIMSNRESKREEKLRNVLEIIFTSLTLFNFFNQTMKKLFMEISFTSQESMALLTDKSEREIRKRQMEKISPRLNGQ